ncbi:MAG: AAA family ATPase [Azospirillum sp.]|nr:AAA family ATPase [Azospirillum sp.]MCA3264704.1 AAA family ATPase [Azospirillum sp.]
MKHSTDAALKPNSTLDLAIELARKGFRIINCYEGTKRPVGGEGWQYRCAASEAGVRKLWTTWDPGLEVERAGDYNIGISTDDLLILDVDVRDGKQGAKSFAELATRYDIPETYTVRTASGGLHYYFRPRNPVGNSNSKVGLHLDVKGWHGQVLGPGSIIDGVPYEVVKDLPIADAPEWLEAAAGSPREKSQAAATIADIELDTPSAKRRAIAYLDSIEPGEADGTSYPTATRLGDFGISEAEAVVLMDQFWNHKRTRPKSPDELKGKVRNAYTYRQNPVGCDSAQADFDVVEIANDNPTPTKRKPSLFALAPWEIEPAAEQAWLIRDVLPAEGMSVIYGPPNAGKSAFAMALGRTIAVGLPFARKTVRQGAVVYVAAEAGRSAQSRVHALFEHHRDDRRTTPFFLVPCPVDLRSSGADTAELAGVIERCVRPWGGAALVVIDTLSRVFAGGDENAPADMTAFVANIDALRHRTKAHVAVVHHPGKDTSKGARGHSSLLAATDTEIEVADKVATITKQRDGEIGGRFGFTLRGVCIGKDDEGHDVTAVVAELLEDSAVVDFTKPVPLVGDAANLMDLVTKADGDLHVDKARNQFVRAREKRVPGKTGDAHKKAFQRARRELIDGGHVEESGGVLVANLRTKHRTNDTP